MEDDEFELDFGEDELDVATPTTVERLVTLPRSSLPIKAAPPVQLVPSTSTFTSTSGSTPFSIPPVPLPGQASASSGRSSSELKCTASSKRTTSSKPNTPVPSPPKPSTAPATSSQPKHDSSKDANGQPMLKGWVSRVSTSTGDIYYRKPATATSPTQSSWYIPGSAEWKADEERKAKEAAPPASTTSEARAAAEKQPLPLSTASKTETEPQSRPSTQKQPTPKHSEGTSELAQGGGWHVPTNTTAAPSRHGPSGKRFLHIYPTRAVDRAHLNLTASLVRVAHFLHRIHRVADRVKAGRLGSSAYSKPRSPPPPDYDQPVFESRSLILILGRSSSLVLFYGTGSDSSRNEATRNTVVTQEDRGPQPSEPARTVPTKSRTPLPPQQAVIGQSTLTDPVGAAPVDGPSRRATPSSMEATRYASPSSAGRDVALRPREAPIANGGPRFAADAPRFATDSRPNRIEDSSRWAQPAPPIQRSADSVPPTVGGANRVPIGNKRPNPTTLDPSTRFASPAVSVAASVPSRRRSPSPSARPVPSPPRRMTKEETRFAPNRDVPQHIRSNLDRDRRPSPPPRRASPPPRRSSPSRRPVSTSNMHPLSAPQASTRPTNPDLELPSHLTRREPPRTTPADLHRDRNRERERELAPHLMNRTPLPPSSSSSSRRRSRSPPPPPPLPPSSSSSSSVSAPTTMNEWTHPDRQALVGTNVGGMSRSSQGWVTNDVSSSGGAERSGYVGVGGVPNAVKNGGTESQGSRPMRTWGQPQSQVVQDKVQELGRGGGEREREDLRRPRGERKEEVEVEVETKRRRVEGAEGRNRGTGWDEKVEREWGTGGWDLPAGANGGGNEGRDERREVRPNEDRVRDRREERRYDDRVEERVQAPREPIPPPLAEERVQAPREPVPPPRAIGQGWETKSTSLSEVNGWETKEQRPATRADDWAPNSNRRDDRPERGDDRPFSDRVTETSLNVKGQGWAWKGKGDGRSLQPPPTEHRRSGDAPSHPIDRPLSDRFNGPSPPLTRQENQNQKWGSGNANGETSISPRLGDREDGAFGRRGSDSLVGRLEGRSLSDRLGGRGGKEGGMHNGGKEALVNRGSSATRQREKSLLHRVDSKSKGSGPPARIGREGQSLLDRLS